MRLQVSIWAEDMPRGKNHFAVLTALSTTQGTTTLLGLTEVRFNTMYDDDESQRLSIMSVVGAIYVWWLPLMRLYRMGIPATGPRCIIFKTTGKMHMNTPLIHWVRLLLNTIRIRHFLYGDLVPRYNENSAIVFLWDQVQGSKGILDAYRTTIRSGLRMSRSRDFSQVIQRATVDSKTQRVRCWGSPCKEIAMKGVPLCSSPFLLSVRRSKNKHTFTTHQWRSKRHRQDTINVKDNKRFTSFDSGCWRWRRKFQGGRNNSIAAQLDFAVRMCVTFTAAHSIQHWITYQHSWELTSRSRMCILDRKVW